MSNSLTVHSRMYFRTKNGTLKLLCEYEIGVSEDPLISSIQLLNFERDQQNDLIEWKHEVVDGPIQWEGKDEDPSAS